MSFKFNIDDNVEIINSEGLQHCGPISECCNVGVNINSHSALLILSTKRTIIDW